VSWRYFEIDEFACHHCHQNLIDHVFVDELDELRHRLGFSLVVTSGYRCPEHNAQISKTGRTGPHTTGRAADLRVDRGRAYQLLKMALLLGFTGIGVHQKGAGRFIHLDNLPNGEGQPRPTVFSY
jgi:zinc D-Ala-D-Ala carboxypeptidase